MIPVSVLQQTSVEIVEDISITALRKILSVLGSRWALNIALILMSDGRVRFNLIRKKINEATPRSISRTLSFLISAGIVEKTIIVGKRREVYYNLTVDGLKIIYGLLDYIYPLLGRNNEVAGIL